MQVKQIFFRYKKKIGYYNHLYLILMNHRNIKIPPLLDFICLLVSFVVLKQDV